MARRLRLRPEVAAFAQLMERELRVNDHKGGWQYEDPLCLLDRLREESRELKCAVGGAITPDPDSVGSEAADVANFAMMIADVCGALAAPKKGARRG